MASSVVAHFQLLNCKIGRTWVRPAGSVRAGLSSWPANVDGKSKWELGQLFADRTGIVGRVEVHPSQDRCWFET